MTPTPFELAPQAWGLPLATSEMRSATTHVAEVPPWGIA